MTQPRPPIGDTLEAQMLKRRKFAFNNQIICLEAQRDNEMAL